MPTLYKLPEELRSVLANAHTHFYAYTIFGPREYVGMTLRILLQSELFSVYVVGDYVCRTFELYVGLPKLCIADRKTLREIEELPTLELYDSVISCRNPAGTISSECMEIIEEGIKLDGHTLLLVDGEEDLLGLAVVLRASQGYLVYGIPRRGVAVLPIEINKVKALNIFSRFRELR